jgi:hypothetical protein
MVTTGSQNITLWGPGETPLGILRVNNETGSTDTTNATGNQN